VAGAIGATSGVVSARADCGARQAEEMSFSATGIRSITRQRPKNTSRRHGMARTRGVRRLAEALRTLLYMPMNGYPAGFTNSWPTILHNARIAPGMKDGACRRVELGQAATVIDRDRADRADWNRDRLAGALPRSCPAIASQGPSRRARTCTPRRHHACCAQARASCPLARRWNRRPRSDCRRHPLE